ncbi:MAG: hypothetical protein JWQ38_1951 [Flavipsychrobacter sp.]|nr:hypothetical protein [Flavipsychrobacter sp.]
MLDRTLLQFKQVVCFSAVIGRLQIFASIMGRNDQINFRTVFAHIVIEKAHFNIMYSF